MALIVAKVGQQLKRMHEAGAPGRDVIPNEGALAGLDSWALGKGTKEPELAVPWIDVVRREAISAALAERHGFGNTVTPLATAPPGDKRVDLLPVASFQKRRDLGNEVKAAGPLLPGRGARRWPWPRPGACRMSPPGRPCSG